MVAHAFATYSKLRQKGKATPLNPIVDNDKVAVANCVNLSTYVCVILFIQVTLVKWNEPYQKLASCDSSGIIFVWIKYEGRWSIELINDRNTQVTDFAWSHDGRMALICYQDGFVLVGSVAGQRYWSSMLNLDATISCGVWAPDDQQVSLVDININEIIYTLS
ncbi:tubby-related protein 4-like [Tropilaelaps mercedesae]|uniref:Tubby-related protein 4-like n=1 Tax=Tropilaelaps mercedesae TaxID=418985 RepID=A0A1V9XWL0_9ACAR|nr:tubby-related protein 4-like [Tropilaelaps mercedesae]